MKLRKFLEEADLNEIAQRRVKEDEDIFNLIFTVRVLRGKYDKDKDKEQAHLLTIIRGLQDYLYAHGRPITKENAASAAKRVVGRLRGIKIRNRSSDGQSGRL